MLVLRSVWAEVMRLRSVAPALLLETAEPMTLMGRVVPTDTLLMLPTRYIQQHAPEMMHICGTDAETFRPERWLRDGEFQTCQHLDAIAFGHGARSCPGKSLADLEGLLLIAEVVRSFRLEPTTKAHIGEVSSGTQMPDRDIILGVVPRKEYRHIVSGGQPDVRIIRTER